jgi:hypothetical protein
MKALKYVALTLALSPLFTPVLAMAHGQGGMPGMPSSGTDTSSVAIANGGDATNVNKNIVGVSSSSVAVSPVTTTTTVGAPTAPTGGKGPGGQGHNPHP